MSTLCLLVSVLMLLKKKKNVLFIMWNVLHIFMLFIGDPVVLNGSQV